MKNNVKYHRFISGELTQQGLGDKVDATRQTIAYIEKGKFNPSVKLALRLAHVLNCKVEDLFQLDESELNGGKNV